MTAICPYVGYAPNVRFESGQNGHFDMRIKPDISPYVERHAAKRADICHISGISDILHHHICPYIGASWESLDLCHKTDICRKILSHLSFCHSDNSPHFGHMVICLNDKSPFPAGVEICPYFRQPRHPRHKG